MATKMQRADHISRRSKEMAESGQFRDFLEIEFALRADGFYEARGQLDSPAIRQFLNELCRQAEARKSGAKLRGVAPCDRL
jgi:hypothetical protein